MYTYGDDNRNNLYRWPDWHCGAVTSIVMDFDVTMDQMNFTEIKGLSLANLTIANNAAGDMVVSWDNSNIEISDIFIELRGVTAAQITAEHFVF